MNGISIDTYFYFCHRSRPRRWWILQTSYIQNHFRMLHYQLLSIVEYNIQFPQTLCSCTFPNSTWNSAQDGCQLSSTRTLNIFLKKTQLFLYPCIENVASFVVFHASQFSGVDATSLFVLLELEGAFSSHCFGSWSSRMLLPAAIGTLSCRFVWAYSISALETDRQLFPAASSTSVLSSVFIGLTREIPNFVKMCPHSFVRPAPDMGVAFTVGEPSFEVVFLTCFSSWRFAVYDVRQKENHWYGYKNTSINFFMLNKQRRWFHSFLEKLLLGRMLACCFLVSTRLLWIVLVQVDTFSSLD